MSRRTHERLFVERSHSGRLSLAPDTQVPLPQLLQSEFGWREMAPLHVNRFEPKTWGQYISAVLTLWNLLDRNIEKNLAPHGAGTPFGYIRPDQLSAYSRLVSERGSQNLTYCEIGFNGGHGVTAMLLASPSLVAHAFELGTNGPYTDHAANLVTLYFGTSRFHYHKGDSQRTVPAFAASEGRSICDILLVDGDHSANGAYRDIVNMRELAKPDAILLIDDISGKHGPGDALRKAEQEGLVRVLRWNEYNHSAPENPCIRRVRPPMYNCPNRWGWAMARYRIREKR